MDTVDIQGLNFISRNGLPCNVYNCDMQTDDGGYPTKSILTIFFTKDTIESLLYS